MIEETLQKIARQIMALNEETLTALLPRYKERMMNFAPTQQWEESVVIYFLINGLRIKNSQFNDKIKEYAVSGESGEKANPHIRPRLRLIKKTQTEGSDCRGDSCTDDCPKKQFTVCQSNPELNPNGGNISGSPDLASQTNPGAGQKSNEDLFGKTKKAEKPEDKDEV